MTLQYPLQKPDMPIVLPNGIVKPVFVAPNVLGPVLLVGIAINPSLVRFRLNYEDAVD